MLASLSKNKERIYSFFVYLIVFLSSIFPFSDKDFGWHYKYGEYLLKNHKLLTSDIYSWTMSGYQWTNHSWAYDPLLYVLTNLTGFLGLSIINAFINLAVFILLTANFKLEYWKKAILAVPFLILSEAGIRFGLRSQTLSMLFFGAVIFLLIKSRENIKFIYPLPLIFLIWANFHGDFTVGLGVMGVYLGSYFVSDFLKSKKFDIKQFLTYAGISVATFVFTFINPFTYRVYLESFKHFSNPLLKNVYEWDPIFPSCGYCHPYTYFLYIALLATILVFYIRRKNWFVLPFLILAVIFVYPTFDTRRLLPLFVLFTLPLFAEFLSKVKFNLSKYKIMDILVILVFLVSVEFNLFTRLNGTHILNYTKYDYCFEASSCSVDAMKYFNKNKPQGRGLTFYDWGGFLIGENFPGKLFVDGRMHLWKDSSGYTAFGDYIKIYYAQDLSLFNKYRFDWVYVPTNAPLVKTLLNDPKYGNWKVGYQDNLSIYFTRNR